MDLISNNMLRQMQPAGISDIISYCIMCALQESLHTCYVVGVGCCVSLIYVICHPSLMWRNQLQPNDCCGLTLTACFHKHCGANVETWCMVLKMIKVACFRCSL